MDPPLSSIELGKVRERNAPMMPAPVPIEGRPTDWNLTTVAPPKNYNVVKPGLGWDDFYNLRRPDVPEEEQTAEMRNLRAWRDANYRMPFDALQEIPERRWFNLGMPIYEFATGFFFGTIFAVIWRGPAALRFFRRLRRGQSAHYNSLTRPRRVLIWLQFLKRQTRVPMLFGVFQLLLRGINPIIDGLVLPWFIGLVLIGANHMRTVRRRTILGKYWGHYRSLGNIHALEHRSILEGSLKDKWLSYIRAKPIWLRRRLYRGMIIIFLIEMLLIPYYYEDRRPGETYLTRGLTSFSIMASPTFGADPPEIAKRKHLKRPEEPRPIIDGATYWTAWLWHNNSPRSGAPYVQDERMFSIPDLRPILEDSPEQRLKYDDTALEAKNVTPAFHMGQKDWKSENAPTGRHEPMVRVGSLPDGRYVIEKICLETLTQNAVENDLRWVDPAMRDIGAHLLDKAAEDEIIYGKITTGAVLTDPWQEAAHRPRIVKDWNRREQKQADEMIAARHYSWSSLPIFSFFERHYDNKYAPVAPTYSIDDGPGGYHNLSDAEMNLRRQYVSQIDPKATPNDLKISDAPAQFWKRLFWKYRTGDDHPPGLPEGIPRSPYVYSRSML